MEIKKVKLKKYCLISCSILLSTSLSLFSQVSINDTGALPNPKAILDISVSTNDKGVLIPRLTTAEITAMGAVPTGMMLFNTDLNDVQFYQGATWEPVGSIANNTLYTGSDTLTADVTVTQLGSKLNFTASSVNAFNVSGAGGTVLSLDCANDWVGIGTNTPAATFHILGNSGAYASTGISNAPFYIETSGSTDKPMNAYFNAIGTTDNIVRHRFANNNNDKWEMNYGDDLDILADTLSSGAWVSIFKIAKAGAITFNNKYTFPITDGTANQVLETDGAGTLKWVTNTAAGVTLAGTETLSNKTLTTPVINTSINDGFGNELIILGEIAGAVNEITVKNGITATGPIIAATGDDANIELYLEGKGTGGIYVSGLKYPTADGTANQVLETNGAGVLSWATPAAASVTLAGSETLTNKTLSSPIIGTGIMDVNSNSIILLNPAAGAVNELTVLNGPTGSGPVLLASGTDANVDLNLDPKGAGNVLISGIQYPNTDGTANQFLKTDGSGSLVWDALDTQEAWQNVTFENSWANYAGYATCQYYKDKAGIIHIKGVVSSGTTGLTIFTLPVGYRPTENRMFVANGNDAFTRIDIGTDGTVVGKPGNTTFTAIEISFRP